MNTAFLQERPSMMSIVYRTLSLRADLLRFQIELDLGQMPTKANAKQRRKELANLQQWVEKEQVFAHMSGREQQRNRKPLSQWSNQDLTDALTTSEALGTLLWATEILDTYVPCDHGFPAMIPLSNFRSWPAAQL